MQEWIPLTRRRPPTLAIVIAAMFIAGFVGIGTWIDVGGFVHRQLFHREPMFCIRSASRMALWNKEIVFAEQKFGPYMVTEVPSRMMALDPATGVVRAMDLTMTGNVLASLVDGDRLWVVGMREVIETDGTTVTKYKPEHVLLYNTDPFLLDGQPTFVGKDLSGRDQLFTFHDGEWQPGRRIALPGVGRTWELDPILNQMRLVPRTSKAAVQSATFFELTKVIQIGDDVYVVSSHSGLAGMNFAYRLGFDFVHDDPDIASALAPENAELETSGWIYLNPGWGWSLMPCNLGGELVLIGGVSLGKPVPSQPGKYVTIFNLARMQWNELIKTTSINLVSSASTGEAYVISSTRFQSSKLFEQKLGNFVALPISLPGNAQPILALVANCAWFSIAVWILSQVILLAGANWLTAYWKLDRFSHDREVVVLGSLVRRWLARWMDLSAMLTPLGGLAFFAAYSLSAVDPEETLEWLIQLLSELNELYYLRIGNMDVNFLISHIHVEAPEIICFGVACAWALIFPLISLVMQGQFGITLGKWICGLRVVSTKLRPCGFLNSLLRELLLIVDSLFFVCPLPAVITILRSKYRQRLGDLFAKTIVIDTLRSPQISD